MHRSKQPLDSINLAGAGNQCRWHFEAACYRDSECQAAPDATRKKGIYQR
jgi:hypothetical protein